MSIEITKYCRRSYLTLTFHNKLFFKKAINKYRENYVHGFFTFSFSDYLDLTSNGFYEKMYTDFAKKIQTIFQTMSIRPRKSLLLLVEGLEVLHENKTPQYFYMTNDLIVREILSYLPVTERLFI